MTLSDLKTLIRGYVPGAKVSVINDTVLELIINNGVDDINEQGALLTEDATFDVTANQQKYLISDNISDYVTVDKPGLWWNSGTAGSPAWKQLEPKTKKWLDVYQEDWRESVTGDPEYYVIDPNEIIVVPTPSASLSSGFTISYIQTPPKMTTGTHYPFSGSDTEITVFRPLDDAIIDYCRWKLSRPLGKTQQGVLTFQEYQLIRNEKLRIVKKRLDISAHERTKMRIPTIIGMGRLR